MKYVSKIFSNINVMFDVIAMIFFFCVASQKFVVTKKIFDTFFEILNLKTIDQQSIDNHYKIDKKLIHFVLIMFECYSKS